MELADLVIVIPGIGGSELWDGRERVRYGGAKGVASLLLRPETSPSAER